MAILLDDLITSLKIQSPLGSELPRDQTTNQIHIPTVERWAFDAAAAINEKRARTTLLEADITIIADQQEYDLPDGCRSVVKITRQVGLGFTDREVLEIPSQNQFGLAGCFPSGQSISPATDLIARQQLTRAHREDDFELIGATIRFLFVGDAGEVVKISYRVVDRTLASVPADRYELVLTYMQMKTIDWFIGKYGSGGIVVNHDRISADSGSELIRRRAELDRDWTAGLNSIPREVN